MAGLRELRKSAHLTQKDIAAAIGVSQASVHQWETGRAMPTLDKLRPLAGILGCSTDDLLGAITETART